MSERWFGVGSSSAPDSFEAGATAALAALSAGDAQLLFVFASAPHDLTELLRGVQRNAPSIPLIGCTSGGELTEKGVSDGTVVVAAIGGSGFGVRTGLVPEVSLGPREGGATLAELVTADPRRAHQMLFVLTDGSANRVPDVVRGAYDVVGASVPFVGGISGPIGSTGLSWQFWSDGDATRMLPGAAVGAAVCSDAPIGVGIRHGWHEIGEPMLVTSASDDGRIHELDGEPAVDAYLRKLDGPMAGEIDAEAFARFAQHYPLGMRRRGGYDVRGVWSELNEERSLKVAPDIAQRGLVRLMRGSRESLLEATDEACREALVGLRGRPAIGLVVFDCVARRAVLGADGLAEEAERFRAAAGGAPICGLYTNGEIARTSGSRGFHNETLVVLAFA